MRLDPLFHWAPSERRRGILAGGLVPYAQPVVHSAGEGDERFRVPVHLLGHDAELCVGLQRRLSGRAAR